MDEKTKNEIIDKLVDEISHMLLDVTDCGYEKKDPNVNYIYKKKEESDYERLSRQLDEALCTIHKRETDMAKLKEQGRETYKNIVAETESCKKLISDKILSDGYRILNDIQVYAEFARKCGMTDKDCYLDMMKRIFDTANKNLNVKFVK